MYSIHNYGRTLLLWLIPVLIANIAISALAIGATRQQNIQHINEALELYVKNTQTQIDSIEHFMYWSILYEPLLDQMEASEDMDSFAKALNNFRTRITDLQLSTGQQYQFFICLDDGAFFQNVSALQTTYGTYKKMKAYFSSPQARSYMKDLKWDAFEIDGQYYLYHVLSYNSRQIICMINVEDVIAPLSNINIGEHGVTTLQLENDQFTWKNKEMMHTARTDSVLTNQINFAADHSSLPFSLYMHVDQNQAPEAIMLIWLFIMILTFTIIVLLFVILSQINSHITKPIQEFSANLASINTNSELLDLQNSKILELEQANIQFKNLMHEIKKLKINIYEQELEKRRIEIDFLRQQIKPHFYLNCLTTIHSMAQAQMYDELSAMILLTINYFRYLFSSDQNYVNLDHEVRHIKDYLQIQEMRFGPTFSFHCDISEDVLHAKIPPLLLQTFIENSIKYAALSDNLLEIFIHIHKTIVDNKPYLSILIQDTGKGFPPDILEKLNNREPLTHDSRPHIGITNIQKRLQLLYASDYKLSFANAKAGSAIVRIQLPFIQDKEENL